MPKIKNLAEAIKKANATDGEEIDDKTPEMPSHTNVNASRKSMGGMRMARRSGRKK